MKLENKSEDAFEVTFDGTTHVVPVGKFEVNERKLGHHIATTAKKWEIDVAILEDKEVKIEVKPEIKAIQPEIKEEVLKPVKKTGGATTASLPQK